MSVEHVISYEIAAGGDSVKKRLSISSGSQILIDESVPGPSTNLEIALVIDVSQLKSIFILTDKNCSLFFNEASTGTPSKTLAMIADQPFVWTNLSLITNPFASTDVTKVFVTKAGSGAMRLRVWALIDPTV